MRACNNTNMRNPIIKDVGGGGGGGGVVRMLVLLHVLIPCLAAYILHLFSYFLALLSLHPSAFNGNVRGGGGGGGGTHVSIVACPHPLSCCIYTALVFLLFGIVIPTSFSI